MRRSLRVLVGLLICLATQAASPLTPVQAVESGAGVVPCESLLPQCPDLASLLEQLIDCGSTCQDLAQRAEAVGESAMAEIDLCVDRAKSVSVSDPGPAGLCGTVVALGQQAVGSAIACAQQTNDTCRNAVGTVEQLAGTVIAAAEACIDETNTVCHATRSAATSVAAGLTDCLQVGADFSADNYELYSAVYTECVAARAEALTLVNSAVGILIACATGATATCSDLSHVPDTLLRVAAACISGGSSPCQDVAATASALADVARACVSGQNESCSAAVDSAQWAIQGAPSCANGDSEACESLQATATFPLLELVGCGGGLVEGVIGTPLFPEVPDYLNCKAQASSLLAANVTGQCYLEQVSTDVVPAPGSDRLSGVVRKAAPGVKGFDVSAVVTASQASSLYAKSYRFAIRYVARGSVLSADDLSRTEADRLLDAGFALMIVQHVASSGWVPSAELGWSYGVNAAKHAWNIGMPRCVNLFLDLEGIASGTSHSTVVAYCKKWYEAVNAAGYTPGLYVGANSILSGSELASLPFVHYWKSLSDVATPTGRGYQLMQKGLSDGVDPDLTQADQQGGNVIWLQRPKVASAAVDVP